jgi:aminoglycoside 6'-N-acetyltransferase I
MMGMAMTGAVQIRMLGKADAALLQVCADDTFDNAVSPELAAEFLGDARHHIAGAITEGTLIGFVSAVHYVHPDKPPELWINEIGVAESYRGQGIGRRLLTAMLSHGRGLGCTEAWVVTEEDNATAQRLYASAGGTSRNVVYFTFPLNDSH